MDSWLTNNAVGASATATATTPGPSNVDEARAAWAMIAKPVTEESFIAWYCGAHTASKKKAAAPRSEPTAAPAAKKQALIPGASAAPKPQLAKGKRAALLKAVGASLKGAIKAKKTKWHAGDADTLAGSTVCDAAEFRELFPGVALTVKGVTTSFALQGESLRAAFGDLKLSVQTWSRTRRSFEKAYKTGSKAVALESAEGKYSTGTSTLTLKFHLTDAGQSKFVYCDYLSDPDSD